MPEMLAQVEQIHRVAQQAFKVCAPPGGNVSLRPGVVYLDDLRCDGAAHGGCEAECRFFWRQEWLEPVGQLPADSIRSSGAQDKLHEIAHANVKVPDTPGDDERWRCQATQLTRIGAPCSWKDPRLYTREIASGNVTIGHFARVAVRALLVRIGRRTRLMRRLPHADGSPVDANTLGLQPGELVEVKSAAEITKTLDASGRHKGLTFNDEMAQHCGKRFRVRRRVTRIIDEDSGRMIQFKKSVCIALEGVVCTGDRANKLWFCRRDLYPFWREAWLRRVEP
jgi:hypothetical protein